MELMLGAELNISDYDGGIDLHLNILRMLDHRIAGLHSLCYTPGTIDQNTSAMIGAIRNPWINIISHPGDGTAPLDFGAIVHAAKEHRTLLEINNSTLEPKRKKVNTKNNASKGLSCFFRR